MLSSDKIHRIWGNKSHFTDHLVLWSFPVPTILSFGKVFCGYHSDSKKRAWKGKGSVCTKSKEWGQQQTDLREGFPRAHRGQQGLPVLPEQGCKFIRPKAAEQSLLFGWRNPKAQRWKEKREEAPDFPEEPTCSGRGKSIRVGDPNLPEGTHGKWRERGICLGLSNAPEGQEMRHAVHYPDVWTPKIRVILMSSSQSPRWPDGWEGVWGVGVLAAHTASSLGSP